MPRCNVKVFVRISLCLIYFYRSVKYNVLTYLSTSMHTGLCIPVGFSCIHMIVFYNQFCSYISLALAGPMGLEHLHIRLVWQVTATCRLFSVSTSDLDLLAWYEVRARPTESGVFFAFWNSPSAFALYVTCRLDLNDDTICWARFLEDCCSFISVLKSTNDPVKCQSSVLWTTTWLFADDAFIHFYRASAYWRAILI